MPNMLLTSIIVAMKIIVQPKDKRNTQWIMILARHDMSQPVMIINGDYKMMSNFGEDSETKFGEVSFITQIGKKWVQHVMKHNCLFHLAVHLRCLNVITKKLKWSRPRVPSRAWRHLPDNLLTTPNYGTSLTWAFSGLLFTITIITV